MMIQTTNDRSYFAAVLRAARDGRTLRSYSRFGSFGRSLTTDLGRTLYPAWTNRPNMTVYRITDGQVREFLAEPEQMGGRF